MSGGAITATSTGNREACGISNYDVNINISDGIITASSTGGGASYGIRQNSSYGSGTDYITGGTINGNTYGISTNRSLVLGNDDGEINIDAPVISGGTHGIYGNGRVYFYDGRLRGSTNAYQDGVIVAIPDGATYHIETIDGVENCWLIQENNYLRVNNVEYNSLSKAFAAANDGKNAN